MNRNITIVVIILIIVVLAGYLLWLRSQFQIPSSVAPEPTVAVAPTNTPTPTLSLIPSATPSATIKPGTKTSTSSSIVR